MKLTETQLREIRERCDAASPQPWTHARSVVFGLNDDATGIAMDNPADASFIAHARTDIPALLDDLEEAKKTAAESYTHAEANAHAHDVAKRIVHALFDEKEVIEGMHRLDAIAIVAHYLKGNFRNFRNNDALKAELEAQRHTALMWEQDFTALCKELGEEVTIETVDSSVQVAIEKVQALKAALAAYRQKKDQP